MLFRSTFPKLKDAIVNLQANASEGMKAVLEGNVEKMQELYAQDPTSLIQSVIEVQRAMGAFQEATNGNIGALKEMAAQDTEVGRLLTALLGLQGGVLDLTAIYKGKLTAAQRESLETGQQAIEALKTGNQEIIDSAKQYNASIKSQSKMLQSLGLSTKELTVDYKSVKTEVRNAERAIIAGMKNGANFTSILAEQINRVKNAYAGLQMGMQISNDKIVQQLDNKIATLQQQGFRLASAVGYADHQSFDEAELKARFCERPLLMTEKDAVKCRHFALANWWYLPVNAELPPTLATLIINKLKDAKNGTRS